MIYAKPNNYGVDSKLYDIQKVLDLKLSKLWGGEFGIYGRIEKLTKNSECYISEKEYKMPFFNDNLSASIAFDITGYDANGTLTADCSLIATVLLNKIFSGDERNDMKALLQVHNILHKSGSIIEFGKFNTGKDVLRDIDVKAPHREMHPWFIFSIDFKVNYKNNIC